MKQVSAVPVKVIDPRSGMGLSAPGQPGFTPRTAGDLMDPALELAHALQAQMVAGTQPEAGVLWAEAALSEHASVASFCRFAQELMALAAPAALVEQALQAAVDEVAHARASFAVASHLLGEAVGPGALPPVPLRDMDAAQLARLTLEEACVDETLGAFAAAEAGRHCSVDALRSVLERIAAEEARHADLAWQTVGWALGVDGPGVSAVLHEWLQMLPTACDEPGDDDDDEHTRVMLSWGVCTPEWHARRRPWIEATVVRPIMEALLSAHGS